MRKLIKKILREDEWDNLQWIKDVKKKWDISNIHLVAGKKFHFNPKMYLHQVSERIYSFEDEIKPQPLKKGPFHPPREIEICWETTTIIIGVGSKPSGIKCGKNSIWRVIDKLNKGEWILLDDVIKESNDLDWLSDTGGNLDKIKVGATFRPTNQYDPALFIKIHKVEFDEEDPMYSRVSVRGLESDGNTFDTDYYLETLLHWLDNGDLELVPDDFDDFGFPEELSIPPISESSELDWIKNEGKERIYIIEKLKNWVKKNSMDADFDLGYDKEYNNQKEIEEYFGKIWFSSDEHYFIELYETKDGFKARFYELFAEENEYLDNWGKSINEPIKSAEDFWRQVAFLIMTYGETTSWDIHKPHTIKESNDFDWAENPIEVGNCFTLKFLTHGNPIFVIDRIEEDGSDLDLFEERVVVYFKMITEMTRNPAKIEPFEASFKRVGELIDSGTLIPMECGNNLNESDDFDWIKDQDPNNVHITDLKLGEVVMINCPFYSFKNRKFTVDEIRTNLAKYKKGDICVHFKEMDKIQYPFGTDREPNIPGINICEHLGCNFKLIKDINESDNLNESEGLDWLMGPPKLTIGKLKGEFYDYLSMGDTIYITGRLFLEEEMIHDEDGIRNDADFIDLYEEPVTVARMSNIHKNDRLNVMFGENIINNHKWKTHISGDWIDLGAFEDDYDLVVTVPNKSINESDDMKWIEDTNTALNMDTKWILVNDIDSSSLEESEEIQKTLFNLGYTWNGNNKAIIQPYRINTIHHFNDRMRGKITYYSDMEYDLSNNDIKNAAEENTEVIYWSDVKLN